ncbi:MAG: SDR family oxidoreductase [Candidatus Azobacteroides sp.]|nr:SDR family oxidoreductase [Candidatus Azobacteroides sp.]
MDFEKKVIVITGAGSGIGHGLALAYADAKAYVVIAEKETEQGEDTLKKIRMQHGNAVFFRTDISKPEEVEELMKKTEALFGKIDILINNAGFGIWKSPYELTLEEWDEVINTNLRGTFLCSREAAKIMRKNNQGGTIVNIASTRAFMSEPDSECYAASKGGIISLTHALAASFSSDRIRVNCISPGWIRTTEYDALRETDHLQHFSNRVGKVEDMIKACFYLTDPENDFINGQNLTIDGGMTKKMIYEPD